VGAHTECEGEAMRVDEPIFTGVGVALATFFDDDGEIDAKATGDHARALVELGIQAVVVAGSTGEERIALLEAVRAAVPAGTPVLQGTGAPSVRQAVALTRDARDHGADAVLALAPPGAHDPRVYYQAVADAAGDLPVLAYHFPQASLPGLPVEVLPELPVRGLKDSTGNPERLLHELEVFQGWLYVGAAPILALAGPLGCPGAILALANAEPELCIAAFSGDAQAQRQLTPSHLAARESFPHGLKQLIAKRFGTPTAARLNAR
jgi:dihydrodipicolinate synthase/N-acetylneuraminate lyase